MIYKKIRLKTVDVRVFVDELLRLGKLGAVTTDICHVGVRGLFKTAEMLIPETVDVGERPELEVLAGSPLNLNGTPAEIVKEPTEEAPKTKRTTRATKDKATEEA